MDLIIVSMFIGWLTCIPAVLLPHSPCRFTTANAPANRQMPIASVVVCNCEKTKKQHIVGGKRLNRNSKLENFDKHEIKKDREKCIYRKAEFAFEHDFREEKKKINFD